MCGAFDDVPDIRGVPTPYTPACDGHPLAPIVCPVYVCGGHPGDAVVTELLALTPLTLTLSQRETGKRGPVNIDLALC